MSISFIIPAYNEEALIARTVDAIMHASRTVAHDRDVEVIVVDDASNDRTAEIAREHGAQVVAVHKRQIAAVRNAGAKAARGDVFIFVDADTVVPPETLQAALQSIESGFVGGGAAVGFDGQVPLLARFILLWTNPLFRVLRYAAGCFIYCRRDAFEAAGGFDERYFASEEIWLSKALKAQGRCRTLKQSVTTSGRKLRQHTTSGLLWFLIRLAWRGPAAVQRREGLELWYDGRREGSDCAASEHQRNTA